MNTYRTIVKTPEYSFKIDHESKIGLIGSCFSISIGEKLSAFKFQTNINPFATSYHPANIAHTIRSNNEKDNKNKND